MSSTIIGSLRIPHHQVAKLHFFIMGFRGDWKALKQVFNLARHYSTDQAAGFGKHVHDETVKHEMSLNPPK